MTRYAYTLVTLAAAMVLFAGCAQQHAEFGAPMKMENAKPLKVADVLANPDEYAGKTICVKGVVTAVCEHAGCWMEIADKEGGDTLFVKFIVPEEGSALPPEAVGHEAMAEGEVEVKTVTQAQRRHYAEMSGKSKKEIEMIVGSETSVQLVSPSIRVAGVEPIKPRVCGDPEEEK